MDTELVRLTSRDDMPLVRDGVVALTSIAVVDFPRVSSNPVNPTAPPSTETTGLNPAKHGNSAQWVGVGVAILIGLGSLYLTWSFHREQTATISSDEHIGKMIQQELRPLKSDIDKRFEGINGQLTDLSGKVGHV